MHTTRNPWPPGFQAMPECDADWIWRTFRKADEMISTPDPWRYKHQPSILAVDYFLINHVTMRANYNVDGSVFKVEFFQS